MTKKQKSDRIAEIKDLLITKGFKVDNYGNYKNGDYRIKIKAVNIRAERKGLMGGTWLKVFSMPIVNEDCTTALNNFLTRFK